MYSLKFCPSWKLFALFFLLGIFLGGCANASELQQALGSEPRALNPSCPIVLGDVDWLGKRTFMPASIVELTADPFTARLRFPTSSGSEDRWLTITDYYALDCTKAGYFSNGGYCVQNMTEVESCITGQFPGLTLEPASLPSGVPTVSPNANAIPSTTNSQQQQPSISIPQIMVYHWEKPNGERIEFKTLEEAKNALANSWEGGKILMETRLPNLTGGYTSLGFAELEGSYVPPFSPPPGVTLNDPNATYFRAVEQNMFFTTLEEALAYAQSQNSATTINQMARGVDYGTAQQVAEFQPIEVMGPRGEKVMVDASTPYIKLTTQITPEVTQSIYYTTTNEDGARTVAYSMPYRSTIDLYKRGSFMENIEVIEAWSPPLELVTAFDGSFADLATPYWVFMPLSQNPVAHYFKSEDVALKFGEAYVDAPCVFPGGLVTKFIREKPKSDPLQVIPWGCPKGLPENWNALDTYYQRGESFFPTAKLAIQHDFGRWYLGYKRDEIRLLRRGVDLETPKINWWAPWQLLALGAALLGRFIQSIRNQPKELVESAAYARHKFGFVLQTVFTWTLYALGVVGLIYTVQYVLQLYGNLTFVLIFVVISVIVLLFFSFAGIYLRNRKATEENNHESKKQGK